jgi:hypothetical protein
MVGEWCVSERRLRYSGRNIAGLWFVSAEPPVCTVRELYRAGRPLAHASRSPERNSASRIRGTRVAVAVL